MTVVGVCDFREVEHPPLESDINARWNHDREVVISGSEYCSCSTNPFHLSARGQCRSHSRPTSL
ncbi:hypothetical protein GYH30_033656 [Glycine max]|nr:hypothetical protein GYH30_033656 [Glycine max]